MRDHLIDEGTFDEDDLEKRDTLPALLFRLESAPDPDHVVALADAAAAWVARYPGFEGLRTVCAVLLCGTAGAGGPGRPNARGAIGGTEHAGDTG